MIMKKHKRVISIVSFVFLFCIYIITIGKIQGEYYKRVAVERSDNNIDTYQKFLKRSLKFYPFHTKSRLSLANTLIYTEKYKEALEEINKADQTGNIGITANKALGVFFLKKQQLRKAEKHLKRASILSPDNPEILEYLAILSIEKKNFSEAIRFLDRATTRDYDRPNSYYLYGKIYEREGMKNPAKARDYYSRALQCHKSEEKLLFHPRFLKNHMENL